MKITSENQSRSFFEPTLAFILLLLLLFGLYNTLSPFFGVFTFAIIFSVSFGQLFEKLAKLLNNKRKLAAFIYAVLLISLMALPFIYLISPM